MPCVSPEVRLRRRQRLRLAEREERAWRRRKADPFLDALTRQLIAARLRARLTQQDVADRMRTTRSAISRLEGGLRHRPRLTTLESYALVVGCRVEVVLLPWP
jgi:DNA-binding XRE family transcriptional regulator